MTDDSNQNLQNAKEQVKNVLQQTGKKPDVLINLGNLAEAALKDKPLYNVFREQALGLGLGADGEIPEQPNPFILTVFVAMGKLTSQMVQSGELGA